MKKKIKFTRFVLTFGALIAIALIGLSVTTAQAQEEPPVQSVDIQDVDGSDVDTSNITPDEVNQVAKSLWCPLCSGVRLDSCELKACDQMKEVIAIKLAQGESSDTIQAYFLEQYGPQVLGAPPLEGFNWLAWILPIAAMIGGGVFLFFQARRLVRPQPAEAVSAANPSGQTAQGDTVKDEYERRLEEELKQYG